MRSVSCRVASRRHQRGVSLIEILIGIVIIVVASIGSLTYFSSALGNVNKQGNRRAALERARERLEQLMAVNVGTIKPDPIDFNQHTVTCSAGTCALSNTPETIPVNNLSGQQPLLSTVRCIHDAAAGTQAGTCDVLELSAKVWFMPGSTTDNDFNRIHIRTLRTPL